MQLQVHLHQSLLHVLDMPRRVILQPLPLPKVGAQTQDHQPVKKFEPNGRNDEQINGGNVRSVNAQERSPICRGWAAPAALVSATRHEYAARPRAGCLG